MGHMRISWLRNDKIEIAKTDLLEVCLLKEGETPMIPFSFSKYFTYSFVYFIYWSLLFYVNEYFYVLILLLLPRSWVIRCDWCLIKIMFPSIKKREREREWERAQEWELEQDREREKEVVSWRVNDSGYEVASSPSTLNIDDDSQWRENNWINSLFPLPQRRVGHRLGGRYVFSSGEGWSR